MNVCMVPVATLLRIPKDSSGEQGFDFGVLLSRKLTFGPELALSDPGWQVGQAVPALLGVTP